MVGPMNLKGNVGLSLRTNSKASMSTSFVDLLLLRVGVKGYQR